MVSTRRCRINRCQMSVSMSSLESPGSSAFTFESSVHSCHVLRCLDDQRRRDLLCDITVVVEGRSFRAHRSVLASCSKYFTHKVSSHAGPGLVITLPQEVTVSGFKPLLQFAYTSKLLFTKDTVVEIRHCASILGFRDLDSACFDFLLPKFFSSRTSSFQRKTCCKTRCRRQSPRAELSVIDANKDVLDNDKGLRVVSDSPVEQDVGGASCQSSQPTNGATGCRSETHALLPEVNIQSDAQTDYSMRCPKSCKFQLACGKDSVCLEVCNQETTLDSPVVTEEGCPLPQSRSRSCLPRSSSRGCKEGPAVEISGENSSHYAQTQTNQAGHGEVEERKGEEDGENVDKHERVGEVEERRREAEKASGVGCFRSPPVEVSSVSCEQSPGLDEGTVGTASHRCPLEEPGLEEPGLEEPGLEEPGLGHQSPGGVGEGGCVLGDRGLHERLDPAVSIPRQQKTEQEQGGRGEEERRKMDRHKEQGGRGQGEEGRRKMDRDKEQGGRGQGEEGRRKMDRDKEQGGRGQGEEGRRKMDRDKEQGGRGEEERRESGWKERSSMETEVAEHLAHGLWSDLSSIPPSLLQDSLPETGPENIQGSSSTLNPRSMSPKLDWLNQLHLTSSTGDCPFLHGLDRGMEMGMDSGTDREMDRGTGSGDAQLPGCEGSSQSEKSPCVSSLTSGDDGDSDGFDTEGDSESCSYSQKARELQLPFPVVQILALSKNDFQLMLKHQTLTREQLDFVHDVRRRSKNRSAAQRCRKRKLDCIHNLECEIDRLRTEKDRLMAERTNLIQMKLKTWQSVSELCQRVCSESALSPEQLQVLASPYCPLSALISPTDPASPGLGGPLQPLASLSACSSASEPLES
ncbi:transcription regulator protein BACH1b isoform X2 [Salmo salar]|uniref:Transcription regulator protein BACH1b isoform X2 n=1 Tax=Salmo salar TaxID=8030 RepID=A0ABM3EQU7_SALSA|nr:transcription regulator protein BACH1 isoform X2 [Salmo salar]